MQIQALELVRADFSRAKAGPLEIGDEKGIPPQTGISFDWAVSEDRRRLGCVLTFGTVFYDEEPWSLVAGFRVLYKIEGEDAPPSDSDLETFVHWNAVLNVWPYWREYMASTVNRAGLPRFIVPVMQIPVPGME